MGKYAAKGTGFYIAGILVGNLTNVGGVSVERENIDATTHDSPGGFREKIMGLRDAGDLDIEFLFDPADAGQLDIMEHANTAETAAACEIRFPATVGYSFTFNAWVASYTMGEAEVEGLLSGSATITVTGAPTLAATVVVP